VFSASNPNNAYQGNCFGFNFRDEKNSRPEVKGGNVQHIIQVTKKDLDLVPPPTILNQNKERQPDFLQNYSISGNTYIKLLEELGLFHERSVDCDSQKELRNALGEIENKFSTNSGVNMLLFSTSLWLSCKNYGQFAPTMALQIIEEIKNINIFDIIRGKDNVLDMSEIRKCAVATLRHLSQTPEGAALAKKMTQPLPELAHAVHSSFERYTEKLIMYFFIAEQQIISNKTQLNQERFQSPRANPNKSKVKYIDEFSKKRSIVDATRKTNIVHPAQENSSTLESRVKALKQAQNSINTLLAQGLKLRAHAHSAIKPFFLNEQIRLMPKNAEEAHDFGLFRNRLLGKYDEHRKISDFLENISDWSKQIPSKETSKAKKLSTYLSNHFLLNPGTVFSSKHYGTASTSPDQIERAMHKKSVMSLIAECIENKITEHPLEKDTHYWTQIARQIIIKETAAIAQVNLPNILATQPLDASVATKALQNFIKNKNLSEPEKETLAQAIKENNLGIDAATLEKWAEALTLTDKQAHRIKNDLAYVRGDLKKAWAENIQLENSQHNQEALATVFEKWLTQEAHRGKEWSFGSNSGLQLSTKPITWAMALGMFNVFIEVMHNQGYKVRVGNNSMGSFLEISKEGKTSGDIGASIGPDFGLASVKAEAGLGAATQGATGIELTFSRADGSYGSDNENNHDLARLLEFLITLESNSDSPPLLTRILEKFPHVSVSHWEETGYELKAGLTGSAQVGGNVLDFFSAAAGAKASLQGNALQKTRQAKLGYSKRKNTKTELKQLTLAGTLYAKMGLPILKESGGPLATEKDPVLNGINNQLMGLEASRKNDLYSFEKTASMPMDDRRVKSNGSSMQMTFSSRAAFVNALKEEYGELIAQSWSEIIANNIVPLGQNFDEKEREALIRERYQYHVAWLKKYIKAVQQETNPNTVYSIACNLRPDMALLIDQYKAAKFAYKSLGKLSQAAQCDAARKAILASEKSYFLANLKTTSKESSRESSSCGLFINGIHQTQLETKRIEAYYGATYPGLQIPDN